MLSFVTLLVATLPSIALAAFFTNSPPYLYSVILLIAVGCVPALASVLTNLSNVFVFFFLFNYLISFSPQQYSSTCRDRHCSLRHLFRSFHCIPRSTAHSGTIKFLGFFFYLTIFFFFHYLVCWNGCNSCLCSISLPLSHHRTKTRCNCMIFFFFFIIHILISLFSFFQGKVLTPSLTSLELQQLLTAAWLQGFATFLLFVTSFLYPLIDVTSLPLLFISVSSLFCSVRVLNSPSTTVYRRIYPFIFGGSVAALAAVRMYSELERQAFAQL